jgi:hypothetical protein
MKTVVKKKKTKPSLGRRRYKRWLDKEKEFVLNERLREAFVHFLMHHPARRFSVNLRSMVLQFMMSGGAEAIYLKDLLMDLDGLFDLLTVVEYNHPSSGPEG